MLADYCSTLRRAFMARNSFRTLVVKAGSNRRSLRILYYIWVAFPYPLRRVVTALFIIGVLLMKKLLRVDNQNALTPMGKLGTLSFWGVPEVDLEAYRLEVAGAVERPLSFSFAEIRAMPSVTRQVRQDCVGGFRNNSIMEGMPLQALLERSGMAPGARRAVFHCADGYYSSIDLKELLEGGAFLVYKINDQEIPNFGYPLRLAIPGKYGYQWAKWVVCIELVTDKRKGYWARLGLPDRGDLGDIW
jgi:DMSO/TMAO reductase YedYZ molybdopterin-dependent catalytic subunit